MIDDKYFMQIAIEEAKKALAEGEVPIGAVLVDDKDGIVVSAHNLREQLHDATAHAEVVAIREAGKKMGEWRLKNCTLYVTVEPCPMCAGAIVMARIKRIVYGIPDSKAGAVESLFNIPGHPGLNHNPEVRAGVLEDECKELMQKFFVERR